MFDQSGPCIKIPRLSLILELAWFKPILFITRHDEGSGICVRSENEECHFFKQSLNTEIKGLLHGYEWGLRFGGLELRLAKKHTSESSERVCFFAKTSTRVHQILISTNYLEVTHFSHEKIQYFPNHSSIHVFWFAGVHVLIACPARASRIWSMHHAMCAWSTLSKRRRRECTRGVLKLNTVYVIVNSSKP